MPEIRHAVARALATAVALPLLAVAPGSAFADAGHAAASPSSQVRQADAADDAVSITSPTSGSTVPSGRVLIAGTGTPGDEVDLTVRAVPGPPYGEEGGDRIVKEDGTWSVNMWLETPATYEATAVDVNSTSSYSVTFQVR